MAGVNKFTPGYVLHMPSAEESRTDSGVNKLTPATPGVGKTPVLDENRV